MHLLGKLFRKPKSIITLLANGSPRVVNPAAFSGESCGELSIQAVFMARHKSLWEGGEGWGVGGAVLLMPVS